MVGQQVKEIALGEDFGEVAITVNGTRVEIHGDGCVEVYGDTDVASYRNAGRVSRSKANVAPLVGDRVSDGTIYVGISPDTGMAMYTTPGDAPRTMKWGKAMDYAGSLDAHGHKDWRLPTRAELAALCERRDKGALTGTFNETGGLSGWYWSATEVPNFPVGAWMERFSDGHRNWSWKDGVASVRPVRSGP